MMKKNILVVDDSALMRRIIRDIINSEEAFQVMDVCSDGLEAYEKIKTRSYDGIVLDVHMPGLDGLGLLERIQKEQIKARVIMVCADRSNLTELTSRAAELGAAAFVLKPANLIEAKGESFKCHFLRAFQSVFHTAETQTDNRMCAEEAVKSESKNALQVVRKGNKIVALACSTGGPKALHSVIPFLPSNLDAPMILVQHMPAGFTKSMANRLNEISPIYVKEAEEGDFLEKGTVYIAPGGKHMEVKRCPDGRHRLQLNEKPPVGGLRPCANITFASLKDSGYDEIVCVILTGMGADGTDGILSLSKTKPVYVISQSEKTCVVYGMPKAIEETGIVDEVVPLAKIAQTITKNVGVN